MKRKPLLPLMPVMLFIAWLVFNNTLEAGQVILGALFAILVTFLSRVLRPLPAWPHRLHTAIIFIVHVIADIIRSNIGVAAVILGAHKRQPHIGFINIPLDMHDPHGLAMLSIVVSATPGTVWASLAADGKVLTLHVLDLKDEESWIRTIKQRYERPLMEIFE